MLDDAAARGACSDYFAAHGYTVDVADDGEHAETLLRFRRYEVAVADLPLDEHGHAQAMRVIEAGHRQNPAMSVVVLTTGPEELHADPSVTVLTKPQRLGAILDAAAVGGR